MDFLGMEKPLGTGRGRDRPDMVVRQGGPTGGCERGATAGRGDLVRTDVLRDTAGLTRDDVRLADGVEESG
ncbi:hypothetical protein, partial [Streptomyces fagopyri]